MRTFHASRFAALILVTSCSTVEQDDGCDTGAQVQVAPVRHSFHVLAQDEDFSVIRRPSSLEVYRRLRNSEWRLCATASLPDDWVSPCEPRKVVPIEERNLVDLYSNYLQQRQDDRTNFVSSIARPRPLLLAGRDVQNARCVAAEGRYAVVVFDTELNYFSSEDCNQIEKHRPWLVVFRADNSQWLVFDEVWIDDPS